MSKAVFITHPLFGPGSSTPANPAWSHNWAAPALNFQRYMKMVAWAVKDEADGGGGAAVLSWAHHWLIHTQGLIPEGRQGADLFLERDQALLQHADELWVGGGREAASLSSGTQKMIEAAQEREILIFNCIAQGDTYVLTPW